MGICKHLFKLFDIGIRIHLRAREAGMAQYLFHFRNFSPIIQHMRRETVPEDMGALLGLRCYKTKVGIYDRIDKFWVDIFSPLTFTKKNSSLPFCGILASR